MSTDKIVKLLNLTTSTNDGEALNAIRIANAIVQKSGLSWEALITRGVASEKPPEPEHTEISIEEMFAFIHKNAWPGFDPSFVLSIEEKFKRTGRLTARQRMGLIKVYRAIKADIEGV